MKLSPYQLTIAQCYDALLTGISQRNSCQQHAFNFIHRQPSHILPREHSFPTPPKFINTYKPLETHSNIYYKEKLLQLAVFEATFHASVTPMTPDMVPLIIDTGASISITLTKLILLLQFAPCSTSP